MTLPGSPVLDTGERPVSETDTCTVLKELRVSLENTETKQNYKTSF